MKLLIAEDDPFFRRILEQLLGSEFEISTAADGNLAWTMLQQETGPRLAILDWVMPGMTGPELAAQINAAHSETVAAARCSLDHALRTGALLTEAKATLRHGEWGRWLAHNCTVSERTARGCICNLPHAKIC